jgi:hypothetical protein
MMNQRASKEQSYSRCNMRRPTCAQALRLFIAILAPALAGCATTVDVGQLSGMIRLSPAPQPVLDYFNGNSVVAGDDVVATNTANVTQVATTSYTFGGGITPPVLAQYTINPNVDAGGSQFAMQAKKVNFQNGGSYRFGTIQTTSPGALISPALLPSASATFDLVECPALANVSVRVTGPAQDIDALDQPAVCTAVATVKENPAGTQFQPQAVSAQIVTLVATLRNEGISIPILTRAGQPVQVSAGCVFTTSQSGFPQDPALPEGTVGFGGAASPLNVACGDVPQVQVDVQVQRSAGIVKGLVDVIGHTESRIRVELGPIGFNFDTNVAANTPPHAWQFDAVPPGQLTVTARALLDNGSAVLRFPQLTGPQSVTVTQGGTTDLGSTFIAVPFTLRQSLTLRDPRPGTRLGQLVISPFTSVFDPSNTSFVKAEGDPNFFVDDQGNPGANGTGARSFSKLDGSFDSAAQQWNLTAALPLVGLSPPSGSQAGNNTLPAPWRGKSFRVQLSDSNVFQESLDVELNTANISNSVPNLEETLPAVNACFGEFALTLLAPPNFSLFGPKLNITSAALQQLQDENGAFLRYDGATGTSLAAPFAEADAASSADARIVLPAFMQYQLQPTVSLRSNATSQVTNLTLATQSVPSTGMLQCGELSGVCAQLGGSGIDSTLRADIVSPEASCDPNNVNLTVTAESTGGTLQSVEVKFDDQAPIAVCGGATPCTNPLQQNVPLGAVAPGQHFATVSATDSLSCSVASQKPVTVFGQPQLVCPQPLVVQVFPGDTEVPFDQISNRLQASWSGGCPAGQLPPIQDDHPAAFQRGTTTTVHFFSGPNNTPAGEQQCETTVTVLPADACNDFQSLPLGQLTAPRTIGDVEYRPLPGPPARVTDQFPVGQPDGNRELEIGGVEARLPFGARWIRLQYVKAHSMPIRMDGFDDSGLLVQTWQSPGGGPGGEPERQRLTRVITGPPRRTLQISAQGGEDLLLSLCYTLNLPPGPRPGDLILVPQP